jgi:membrane protease YdiL (CAAX protease family)
LKNGPGAPAPLWILCLILASVALAFRPAAPAGSLAVAVAVGLLGLLAPVPSSAGDGSGRLRWLAATGLGIAAAVTARAVQHPAPPPPAWFAIPAIIAAVAEEVFFRRLLYGWLAPCGPVVAIGGAAAIFAAIHVPAYGLSALPVDFAAGLMFGWQRWATGTWSSAAVTHATANLLQMR